MRRTPTVTLPVSPRQHLRSWSQRAGIPPAGQPVGKSTARGLPTHANIDWPQAATDASGWPQRRRSGWVAESRGRVFAGVCGSPGHGRCAKAWADGWATRPEPCPHTLQSLPFGQCRKHSTATVGRLNGSNAGATSRAESWPRSRRRHHQRHTRSRTVRRAVAHWLAVTQ